MNRHFSNSMASCFVQSLFELHDVNLIQKFNHIALFFWIIYKRDLRWICTSRNMLENDKKKYFDHWHYKNNGYNASKSTFGVQVIKKKQKNKKTLWAEKYKFQKLSILTKCIWYSNLRFASSLCFLKNDILSVEERDEDLERLRVLLVVLLE